MSVKVKCPKCNSLAWYVEEDHSLAIKCSACGLLKFVERVTSEGMVICNRVVNPGSNIPRRDTKLYNCLMALEANAPARTGEIAELLGQPNSVTASQLTVLGLRGLVEIVTRNRGVPGGSLWTINVNIAKLL